MPAQTKAAAGRKTNAVAPAVAEERTVSSQALPSVDRGVFRGVMGSLASGVSVVTTLDEEGTPRGFTCSAVCSVSAEPPLLLAGVANNSGTLRAVRDGGRFAVNVLGSQGQEVSNLFASDSRSKFDRVRWEGGEVTGMPLLRVTVAHAECVLDEAVTAGDHTLLIGRIVGGGCEQGRPPLTYWRGGYGRLLHPAVWQQHNGGGSAG